ncbi:Crp/Fnr family transcriptional regulator [Xanthovirga aplysinae]|uniref:Crp/Fnr family transcriptional regulator n=1 Tax=Xanthovirga aplysinae TaxID=2529853 RepID=UPI0012BCD04F|nr:Crp/Fnr family transcriptional regulator [Xanthovirga aplysinae]MTI32762.1 Crp/Fnr family transcriptional regulator [Xanthovirga aplysinae]
MNNFRDILIDKIGLQEEHYLNLSKVLKKVYLKKKDFLLKAGNICSFIGFIQEGVLRSYVQKDGDEFNIDIYLQGSFVSSYTSFLTQMPSKGNLQALADTTIYIIPYKDYSELLKSTGDWYLFGKYLADTLFIKKCQRETSLLTDSATERYRLLLKTYPQIEQLVTQYHIASYLGIKPESLSRIKSLTYINE